MKLIIQIHAIFLLICVLISCGSDKESSSNNQFEEVKVSAPSLENVTFKPISFTNAYPDAILELYSPLENESFEEGKVSFEFNIKNFPFENGIKGFQLKMILNGNDPVGYNMPIFNQEFEKGTYRAVAYLVDENGMALKEYGNYVDRDFTVGGSQPFPESGEPFLALNSPVNDQEFEKGEPVIVDFLLIGGDLEEEGLQVEIAINDKKYTLQKVVPVEINGLPKGFFDLKVTLKEKNGEELKGAFSQVQKEIIIN
ncbi:hypothetical protein QWY93_05735 [Echinicola jeungdonensis]|uniref:Uncharacterized protein n=1 Tax=Echinicola jeungdonensis TaxID=709343 RepID=A0ABV5J4V4_9BACT|nr:hypothetical protein [Echinicola jeungdonensis]MDN3668824.1 hypothetical protein [Echinicola jeungdonensis]